MRIGYQGRRPRGSSRCPPRRLPELPPRSTAAAPSPAKHALLEALHRDPLPAPEQPVHGLPDALTDAARAEQFIRRGALAAARQMLAAWGKAADPAAARPTCAGCRLPMRHKGCKEGAAVTTLAPVRSRRPRYRCGG
ncbi:MAG TPA: hypothetical protein VFA26_13290, partial [Gemmataceae bacterium]|nr:hypothetical protein [Gemmataceae bacterium]